MPFEVQVMNVWDENHVSPEYLAINAVARLGPRVEFEARSMMAWFASDITPPPDASRSRSSSPQSEDHYLRGRGYLFDDWSVLDVYLLVVRRLRGARPGAISAPQGAWRTGRSATQRRERGLPSQRQM